MKSLAKPNDIIGIIKSGIAGALALTGICIILIILGSIVRVPLVTSLYAKVIAKCSLQGIVLAAGGFGFILGLLLRRRLPVIQKGFAPLVIAAIPLIVGVLWMNAYVGRVSTPQTMKLADCTNSIIKFHLKIPKGHSYVLGLEIPGVQQSPNGMSISSYRFSGHIHIVSGTSSIADFPISSDQASLGISGFGLTSSGNQNTNLPALSQFVHAQEDCDIEIAFEPPPPPSSYIWLYWLQSARD